MLAPGEKLTLKLDAITKKRLAIFCMRDDGELFNYDRIPVNRREIKVEKIKVNFKGTISAPE